MSLRNTKSYDEIIVSAFGRGFFLAEQLVQSGREVLVVDVTQQLGQWSPEDCEGPFGFFHSLSLKREQKQRIEREGFEESIPQGFVVWLKDRVIELKGPLGQHALEKAKASDEVLDYLMSAEVAVDSIGDVQLKNILRKQEFKESWLAHLAHNWASLTYHESSKSLESVKPLSLFSLYSIVRVSQNSASERNSYYRENGVDVIQDFRFQEIEINKNRITQIVGHQGSCFGDEKTNFIWMLSGQETECLRKEVSDDIFPKGVVQAQWDWRRFRFQVQDSARFQVLPTKTLLIEDLFLPWAYDNFISIEKTRNNSEIDVWCRWHSLESSDSEHELKIVSRLKKVLENRLVCPVDAVERTLQKTNNKKPPRFPVFTSESLSRLSVNSWSNFLFAGPEKWGRLDWLSLLEKEEELVQEILKPKNQSLKEAKSLEVSIDR